MVQKWPSEKEGEKEVLIKLNIERTDASAGDQGAEGIG